MIYMEKSQPEPDCLVQERQKANGDYKCGCVLDRLKADFKNKCYICGNNAATSINVEHFKPHRGDHALKFDWLNLFFACAHCNQLKSDKYDNMINCTDIADAEYLAYLHYFFNPFPYQKVRIEAISQNDKVIQTQQLLLSVFNGTTKLKTLEAANLRERLLEEIKDFQEHLINYAKAHDLGDKDYHRRKIRSHLNDASPFVSFKRQIINDTPELACHFAF